jgi:hypothetical protein
MKKLNNPARPAKYKKKIRRRKKKFYRIRKRKLPILASIAG